MLAAEICKPATDARLRDAVRLSVALGGHVIMETGLARGDQGQWEPLIEGLPANYDATTLTIRVEAVRDFERAPTGEFPLLLRLRRLRIFRLSDPKALWKLMEDKS